jgi:hypothetical protein
VLGERPGMFGSECDQDKFSDVHEYWYRCTNSHSPREWLESTIFVTSFFGDA